jgi:hypothetical protein
MLYEKINCGPSMASFNFCGIVDDSQFADATHGSVASVRPVPPSQPPEGWGGGGGEVGAGRMGTKALLAEVRSANCKTHETQRVSYITCSRDYCDDHPCCRSRPVVPAVMSAVVLSSAFLFTCRL